MEDTIEKEKKITGKVVGITIVIEGQEFEILASGKGS